jgi:hypothetical protein
MHLRLTVLASLAVTLVACADDPIRSVTPEVLEIPPLFAVGDNGTGTFATFEPIPASAVCTALPATLAGFATYNPFVSLRRGIHRGFSRTRSVISHRWRGGAAGREW